METMTTVLEPLEVPVSTPKPTIPTIADTLYQAADLLEKGWCIGTRFLYPDRYCALGAFDQVTGHFTSRDEDPAVVFLAEYLIRVGFWPREWVSATTVAQWNNRSTQDIVVSTFRQAADQAVLEGV